MKDKKQIQIRVFFTRIFLAITLIFVISLILFENPTIAAGDEIYKSANKSNFYMKLIGNTIGTFKVAENCDDKKIFNGIVINPLEIIQREISCLDGCKIKDDTQIALNEEETKKAENIVINPFKLKDEDVKKIGATVDIIGNPEDNSKKKILIYHTHTNEAYAEGNSGLSTTVAAVGDMLTSELETMGFTVIHDKTVHDVDYNNAYYASKATLESHLNSYGDFDLIIDLHRDGGPSRERVTTTIDGDSMARVMFVTTEQDPRYSAHIANLESITEFANSMYPSLIRDKNILTYPSGIIYYSQDLSDNAILMEVGADVNTLDEAKNSMKCMSKVLAAHLNSK